MLFLASALWAAPGDIIPLQDDLYDQMDRLFLLVGTAGPSTARPWSMVEAEHEFLRLDEQEIPGEVKPLYEKVARRFQQATSEFQLGLTIAPELYVHQNTDFTTDSMWVYGWTRRKPFASLFLRVSVGGFSLSTGLEYGWGRVTYKDDLVRLDSLASPWVGIGTLVPASDGSILTVGNSYVYQQQIVGNFPNVTMLEIDTPRRTTFSFALPYLAISVSRDQISWGTSHIGNFIFDAHVDRADYLRLSVFGNQVGMTFVLMPLDMDYSNANSVDSTVPTRLFLAHRLDWKPVRWFSFALSENIMYCTDQVKLQYLNPAFIYHNLNASDVFNAIAHLELEVVPVAGWKLFTQFCLDQAKAITENEKQPTSWGLSGGVRHAARWGNGVMTASLEGAYTTPWLYRRQNVDFLIFHRYATNVNYKKIPLFTYLGFPYGGDAIVGEADLSWKSFEGWEISLKGLYLVHGEVSLFSAHNDRGNQYAPNKSADKTPTGDPWYAGYGEIGASYPFEKKWGTMRFRTDLAVVSYQGMWDVQGMVGGEIQFRT